jgi:hypothetical protein
MGKIPGIAHLRAVKALERAGFRIARQGKHIVMTDVRELSQFRQTNRRVKVRISGGPLPLSINKIDMYKYWKGARSPGSADLYKFCSPVKLPGQDYRLPALWQSTCRLDTRIA